MPRRDLVIIPDDEPGVLARLGEVMGGAGLNIEALSAFTGGGKGVVHILVDDHEKALGVLQEAGFDVRAARRVAVVPIDDAPGALGRATRTLAEADINIEGLTTHLDGETGAVLVKGADNTYHIVTRSDLIAALAGAARSRTGA